MQPIFVAIHPQRETREALREYVKGFDERVLALTGSADQLEEYRRIEHYGLITSRTGAKTEV